MRQGLIKAKPGILAPTLSRISVAPRATAFTSAHLSTITSQPSTGENTSSMAQHQATSSQDPTVANQKHKKTMKELDEELRLKLEGMSGEGGAAGVEYENGKAEGLKRGVKSNMFRVI
ncbi:hypothetical protein CkaCkLH20_00623 [Colletotrichum karsti]|uniref:Uncharacterized protein n=1 Tax=Colletotrichum karsti TaxID=1095194 RepID=A0A9P6LQZ4_9PEZI|nr:uncharacterized protein CkaCkLH20_00623 [Colletotrichum karsti]KAF9881477.1 hypothetical protein CkaCkLH20_00623 [Colletotrichum karsti]